MYNHQQLIIEFVKQHPEYQTTGLSKSLSFRFPPNMWDLKFTRLGYIPDAFYLGIDQLHLVEVDKSSVLDNKKLPRVLYLWETLDHIGFPMEMTIISGYTKAVSKLSDSDFSRMWHDAMLGAAHE